jgi:hypothetical protein
MFCGKCGTKNDDDALFCCGCGFSLKNIPIPTSQSMSAPISHQEQRAESTYSNQNRTEPNPVNRGNVDNVNIVMGNADSGSFQNESAGFAIASMILGIVALVTSCCFYYISLPCAIISVILAAVSLKNKKGGKGMAIAGLVCSIISLVPAAIMISTGAALASAIGAL